MCNTEKERYALRLQGRIWKDGRFWLVEVPWLDAMTQGRTRREALAMIVDYCENLARDLLDVPDFRVTVHPLSRGEIEISSGHTNTLLALILQTQRHASGLTLVEVAARLDQTSPNTYSRYERGKASPTVAQLVRLLTAVDPRSEIVLGRRSVPPTGGSSRRR
jgi:hypothetical protein